MKRTNSWLKQLTEAAGVSGYEQQVKELLKGRLAGKAEVSYDKIGSVIFKKTGSGSEPKIMLASHMDEIGFMIKYITKEGFLKFTTLGGWWEQVMLGQRVTIHTGKGEIPGVIGSKPPHILSPEERKKVVEKKDMYIDIGAQDEQEAKERFGVRPGDAVVPYSEFTVLANEKMLMAKAWDNRVGCAVMVEVMERLAQISHPNTFYGVGTVQEEVGLRGAMTSASVIKPDIGFAIDTCVAGDTPGVSSDQASSKLGKGVAISIFDSSLIPHAKLRQFVTAIAEERKIPYQLEFTEGGGTDAGRIHLNDAGVPSLVLSIPTRYIHSHNSIIHWDDCQAAADLLVAVAESLDYEKYRELIE
ncbi:MAG: M42 family metallopeptidase [Sporomusaceae bacterium]|nr:M42 family metallopeptidase [Sporomusaceae bacterium]